MKAGRFEIRELLGEGGMGLVYRAWDPLVGNEVCVKTIRDPQNKSALELFERERAMLASIAHPNIVTILHLGDFEERGITLPYFVMPFLKGATLQKLIDDSSTRLSLERCVHIMAQICKGLQAAHDHGIVHRDIKPSNLFVLPDDSVVVIDFGMAHLSNTRSTPGIKGTPPYMAPEQLAMRQPTPQSDQFSLAVVCYQILARRHPFYPSSQGDLRQAIATVVPQPISKYNPMVNSGMCEVVHMALAKNPVHRHGSIREFSDKLQKALRGEAVETIGKAILTARLQEARAAIDADDLDEAREIVEELAAQTLNSEVVELEKQITEKHRSTTILKLLDKSKRYFASGKYTSALKHVQEILDLDPENTEAFTLKGSIDGMRSESQISDWFGLANKHVDNRSFQNAREALEKVLDLRPNDIRAKTLLTEVERLEQDDKRAREQHQKVYDSAMESFRRGDLNSAVRKLEQVLDLDRKTGNRMFQDQGVGCQQLYEEVRSKRDQLTSKETEARRNLQNGNLIAARAIVEEVLAAFPKNVLFRVLSDDIVDAERQALSEFLAWVEKTVAAEPDFGRKVAILEEAQLKYPSENRIGETLQGVRTRRNLIDSIAGQARTLEEQRQFSDALGKWETLRSIHPQYPGLDVEMDRLRLRREQQALTELKVHRISLIEKSLALSNYIRATSLVEEALAEFPGDPELIALAQHIEQIKETSRESEEKSAQAKALYENGDVAAALELLRDAHKNAPLNVQIRSTLIEVLLCEANAIHVADWKKADPMVGEVLKLDPQSPQAKSLQMLIQDSRQRETVTLALTNIFKLRTDQKMLEALSEADKLLAIYPKEQRVVNLRIELLGCLSQEEKQARRAADLAEINRLAKWSKETNDPGELDSIFEKTREFSQYEYDVEFKDPFSVIEECQASKVKQPHAPFVSATPPPIVPRKSQTPKLPRLKKGFVRLGQSGQNRISAYWRQSPFFAGFLAFAAICAFIFVVQQLIGLSATNTEQNVTAAKPTPIPTKQKVLITGVDTNLIRVFDSSNTEVTSLIANGLLPGEYRIEANRLGFEPYRRSLTIGSDDLGPKTIDVQWMRLPTQIKVMFSNRGGSFLIDDQRAALDSSDEFAGKWQDGIHSFKWSRNPGEELEVSFDIKDGEVKMEPAKYQPGRFTGLLAVCSSGKFSYQAINASPGLVKQVGDKKERIAARGSFDFGPGSTVNLRTNSGDYPLGEFNAPVDGAPTIYVKMVPIEARREMQKQPAAPFVSPQSSGTVATPDQLALEEKRKQIQEKLKKLGNGSN